MIPPNRAIRVLIVDDSSFIRAALRKQLEQDSRINVVGEAYDGMDALLKIPQLNPDVITLDVQMPRMDGLETLQRIMAEHPRPVIMLSALTQRGTRTTIQALMRGAVDFVAKPNDTSNMLNVSRELITKIKTAASAHPAPLIPKKKTQTEGPSKIIPSLYQKGDPLIIIGASTGGPRALRYVLEQFPADFNAAIVVVQHIPAGFTKSLAQRLDHFSALSVQEAAAGDRLANGLVLVAPGGYHLRFEARRRVILDESPRRNGVRPSIDTTLESAAEQHGKAVIGVILTGMGSDGTQGAQQVKAAGGRIISEDTSTCVVYGMPRSVEEAGLSDHVVPLPKVAATLIKLIKK